MSPDSQNVSGTQGRATLEYLQSLSTGDELEIPDRATPFIVTKVEVDTEPGRAIEWEASLGLEGKRGGEYWMSVTQWKEGKLSHSIRRKGTRSRYWSHAGGEPLV